jgi:hypothetical protein
MKEIVRIQSAEPVIPGVLKILWQDGYIGVVDLRPLIAKGQIFDWLKEPTHFEAVTVDDDGYTIAWIDGQGRMIDLGSRSLREKAEGQADLIRLAG